jgi:ubiquinone/menaquinone biosynthesis C-methylase UbiE
VAQTKEEAMAVQLDEFKTRQRAVWGAGDYGVLSARIAEVGALVVERAGIGPSMRVLDVACGTGNATIPAARAGARVTGLDLVPKLLEEGRAKAEAAGVEIEWVEGDAEELPFEDGSFDRVLSTFGHMFAPRHRRTADELARVCRKSGAIVFAAWTPEGTVGAIMRAGAPFMPPPPEYASPPLLWGTEQHVRELFGPVASEFEFERHVNWVEADALEAWADYFMDRFPTMVAARAMLGDRFEEFREQVVAIWRDANEAGDGSLRLPQEYLLSVVRM